MGRIAAPKTGQLLAGWSDDALHPNVVEALKRMAEAEAAWAHAMRNIEGQYLSGLIHAGVEHAQQAQAVRKLMA